MTKKKNKCRYFKTSPRNWTLPFQVFSRRKRNLYRWRFLIQVVLDDRVSDHNILNTWIIFTEWTPTLPGSDNHRLHWDLSLWKLVQYGRATRPGKTPSLQTKKKTISTKNIYIIQTIITIIFTSIGLSFPLISVNQMIQRKPATSA